MWGNIGNFASSYEGVVLRLSEIVVVLEPELEEGNSILLCHSFLVIQKSKPGKPSSQYAPVSASLLFNHSNTFEVRPTSMLSA